MSLCVSCEFATRRMSSNAATIFDSALMLPLLSLIQILPESQLAGHAELTDAPSAAAAAAVGPRVTISAGRS